MSKSLELAFSQAVASVALETKTMTAELISLLKQAIIEKRPPNEILDILASSH